MSSLNDDGFVMGKGYLSLEIDRARRELVGSHVTEKQAKDIMFYVGSFEISELSDKSGIYLGDFDGSVEVYLSKEKGDNKRLRGGTFYYMKKERKGGVDFLELLDVNKLKLGDAKEISEEFYRGVGEFLG